MRRTARKAQGGPKKLKSMRNSRFWLAGISTRICECNFQRSVVLHHSVTVFTHSNDREGNMKTLSVALIVSALGLVVVASPAEAAKKKVRHHAGVSANAMVPGGTSAEFQGGVMRGPLYNGQDYLGDDPDPNIRAYLLRDLSGRYGGGR